MTGKSTAEIIAMAAPSARLAETADPGAVAHVEAHALFLRGLRCGRHGRVEEYALD
jgi:hypothetical protein